MALSPCRECGAQISSAAKACPRCGVKKPVKQKTSILTWAILAVVAIGAVNAAARSGGGNPPTATGGTAGPAVEIKQLAYFRDDGPHRIYTFEFPTGTPPDRIQEHAQQQRHTEGNMTAAYYYVAGSVTPGDRVTTAANMIRATDILYDSPGLSKWRYAFMRAITGEVLFVDCEATPKDILCRQR